MSETRMPFSSHEVAQQLKVQNSTLRKYCLMLEREGYSMYKNDQGVRGFFDRDMIVLRKLIDIKKQPGMTLEQACKVVTEWIKHNEVMDATDITDNESSDITSSLEYNNGYSELMNQFEKLQEFNQILIKQLDKQQKEIDYKLDNNHQEVLEAIKESKEQQVLIAAAVEKTEDSEPKKKKKFWSWLK